MNLPNPIKISFILSVFQQRCRASGNTQSASPLIFCVCPSACLHLYQYLSACMVQPRTAFSSPVAMTTAIRPIGAPASAETLPVPKRVAVTQTQAARRRRVISHAEMKVLWLPCNRFSYLET